MKYSLSSLCEYRKGKVNVDELNKDTYISTENMLPNKGGVIRATSLPTISQTQEYKKGDVLVSNIRPYFKKIWQAEYDGGCSNDVLVFKANENTDKDFLYYVLADDAFFNYSMATSKGTKMPRGDKTSIMQYGVPHYDIVEQKKIACVLHLLDKKIEFNNKINDNLLQQAQAIYMHIFGEKHSVTPATVADIALNVTDGVHNTVKDDPAGQYLLLSCKNIKGGLLSIGASERRINSETFEKLRRRTKLAKGDILISSVGTDGEVLLLNTEPSNYEFQRSVAMVKPNPEIVSPAYVYESFIVKRAELINAAHGAVQQCLFISDIAEFPIGIPNSVDLHSFDEVVNPMFDTITANEAENLRIEALRDALLPKLMSGELDVSDIDL